YDADDNVLKIKIKSLPRNGGSLMVGDRVIQLDDQLNPAEFEQLAFKPDERFVGVAGRLRLEVDDGAGGVDLKMVDLKIDRPNLAPILRKPDRRLLAVAGQLTPLNILPPFDRDGDALTITIAELSSGGRFVTGDKKIREGDVLTMSQLLNLAVMADHDLIDHAITIAYAVDDDRGGRAVGRIEIFIEAPNSLPIAPHKGLLTFRADQAPFTIMGEQRPSDPDGDPLTVSIQDVPEVGVMLINQRRIKPGDTISVSQLMKASYVPPRDFVGFAGLFRYLVRDSRGGTAHGFVELIIEPANRAPLAAKVSSMEIESGGKQMLLSMPPPHDPDDDQLEVQIIELSDIPGLILTLDERVLSKGDLLDISDLPRVNVQASIEAVGKEGTLRFEVRDGKGGRVITGKNIKIIEPPNRAPIIRLAGTVQVTKGDGPQDLGLLEPTDPEGDPLTVRLTALPEEGVVQLDGKPLEAGAEIAPTDIPDLRYDPGDQISSVLVWISFAVVDDGMAEAIGNVPIMIVAPANRPPQLPQQPVVNAVVGVGQIPLPVEPPTDPDQDQLTIEITALPDHGRLTFGHRKAFEGMELTVDAFVDARFTPDPPRKKRQVADQDTALPSLSSSSLIFVANDGRGGISEGEVEIKIVLHPCDQQASTPGHPDIVAPPVEFDSIDANLAIESCSTALADYGNIVRFRVQLGRALHVGGQYAKAKNAYFEATNAGDPVAQHNLALLILDPPAGLDIQGDERAFAIRLLSMASKAGLIPAQKHLAQALWDIDRQQALQWLERASERQDPEAMTQLAMAYALDDSVERPFDVIVELLEGADALGHVEATTNLGYVYARGVHGGQDYQQAIAWFRKAVDLGDMKAAINLGNLYRHGKGATADPIKAIELFATVACAEPEHADLREVAIGYLDTMPRPDRIGAIQTMLRRQGYDVGPGEDAAKQALELYRSAKGMPQNGAFDTIALLNLWGCDAADGIVN
ncbi:MAG: Ig-like domain-containing protein, partial [Geminicoccaceae bacterium]